MGDVATDKVKVSDLVVRYLESRGVRHIFMISGGGNMHLVDSVGSSQKIKYVCNHHEQAGAIAAEAYGRFQPFGVCLVTTGPGGTNTLTGVAGAWLDSIPMLAIAGQVNVETMVPSTGLPLRQFGYQELNLVDIVKPMTKYAVTVTDPVEAVYHLEKALDLAMSGRPGPVWVEYPLNVQGASIDPATLRHYQPLPKPSATAELQQQVAWTITKLRAAGRPVLYAGNGIRIAGAAAEFRELVELLKVPVLSGFAGYDLIPSDYLYYVGRPHTFAAQRAANFIVQNCDTLLGIGVRFDLSEVSYNYRTFARAAYRIVVDVDPAELAKPAVKADLPIAADAKLFIKEMLRQLRQTGPLEEKAQWLEYCRRLNSRYPVVLPEYWGQKGYVNSYCFVDRLAEKMEPGSTLVVSDGTALTCTFQAFRVKENQRVVANSGCAAMGYGLPAAIGACFATGQPVTCLEGDGSLQLNIQELQTIKHHGLPIKLFVYNNQGYLAIKVTQRVQMGGRYVASDPGSGVSVPDFVKVATAYGIPAIRMETNADIDRCIEQVMAAEGPILCEVMMDPHQVLQPKLIAERQPDGSLLAKPMEDLFPFLPRDEFQANMLVPLWEPPARG